MQYASYLSGNGNDKATGIAVDAQGAMYVLGTTDAPDFPTTNGVFEPACPRAADAPLCYYDVFVRRVAPDGSKLAYSTYLTSNDQSGLEYAAPCPNSFQDRRCFDATITMFNTNGALVFSSSFGGKFDDYGNDVVLGADGSIYLAGATESLDFPTTPGVVQPAARSGKDAFLVHLMSGSAQPVPSPNTTPRVFLPTLLHEAARPFQQ